MNSSESADVDAHLLEVIENQIRDNNPPQTAATVQRLCEAGSTRAEAMALVACVLAHEIHCIVVKQETFNLQRYVGNLERLPELP